MIKVSTLQEKGLNTRYQQQYKRYTLFSKGYNELGIREGSVLVSCTMRNPQRPLAFALVIAACLLGGMAPPSVAPEIEVAFIPGEPTPGEFVQLEVRSRSGAELNSVRGMLARQAVFFERDSQGSWIALAGIPVSASDSIDLNLNLVGVDGVAADTVIYIY